MFLLITYRLDRQKDKMWDVWLLAAVFDACVASMVLAIVLR